jgi:hypothetical protein
MYGARSTFSLDACIAVSLAESGCAESLLDCCVMTGNAEQIHWNHFRCELFLLCSDAISLQVATNLQIS